MAIKIIATNRKAHFNYHIEEGVEAGIALTGTEIKSVRDGRVNLGDSYVKPEGRELWLMNAHIARYDAGGRSSHEPTRSRRLLLHRRQIEELARNVQEKGLTIVPLKVYLKNDLAKVEIALARGKRQYDKREAIARREVNREMGRAIRRQA